MNHVDPNVSKLRALATGHGDENRAEIKSLSKGGTINFNVTFEYTDYSDLLRTKIGTFFHACVSCYKGEGKKLIAADNGLSELVETAENFAENLRTKNPTVIEALKAYNSDGETPLHLAARLQRLEMVKILIKLGADINQPLEKGCKKMGEHLANKNSEVEIYLKNLRHECDFMECLRDGEFTKAINLHLTNASKLQQLISSTDPSTGDSPMIMAIKGCNKNSKTEDDLREFLVMLSDLGFDMKRENKAHETALLLLIRYRYLNIFDYFLQNYQLIPPQTDYYKNPILFELLNSKDKESREFLQRFAEIPTTDFTILASTEDKNIFHDCASSHDIKALTAISEGLGKLLIPNDTVKRALCKRSSSNDFTPLHIAAHLGFFDCVKLFIEKLDADWTLTSKDGTPEEIAHQFGRIDVANYLKSLRHKNSLLECFKDGEFDAAHRFHISSIVDNCITSEKLQKKVEEIDPSTGDTPLLALFYHSSPNLEKTVLKLVNLLLEAGADPNTKNGGSKTALLLSFQCGYKEVFKFLLKKTDLTLEYSTGNNLLHEVAGCSNSSDKIEMLQILLVKMIDKDPLLINKPNTIHHTPLFEVEDPDILRCFLKNGAKATQEVADYFLTKQNRTALLPILKEYNQEINYEERLLKEETFTEHVRRSAYNGGHSMINAGGIVGQGLLDLLSAGVKLAGDAAIDFAKNNIPGNSGK